MNVKERSRGFTKNTLRFGAAVAAGLGIYYGVNALPRVDHQGSDLQSSTIGEPKRDYFADFTIDGTKVELTDIQEGSIPQEGKKYVAISGKASKSPAGSVLSGRWKFNIALGGESYQATLAQIEVNSGDQNFPVSVVITAIIPDDLQGYRLDIANSSPPDESANGGVGGDSAMKSIPLPVLARNPNRT